MKYSPHKYLLLSLLVLFLWTPSSGQESKECDTLSNGMMTLLPEVDAIQGNWILELDSSMHVAFSALEANIMVGYGDTFTVYRLENVSHDFGYKNSKVDKIYWDGDLYYMVELEHNEGSNSIYGGYKFYERVLILFDMKNHTVPLYLPIAQSYKSWNSEPAYDSIAECFYQKFINECEEQYTVQYKFAEDFELIITNNEYFYLETDEDVELTTYSDEPDDESKVCKGTYQLKNNVFVKTD